MTTSIAPALPCWGPCSKWYPPAYFALLKGEPHGRDWVCKECRAKGFKGPPTEFNTRGNGKRRKVRL